MDHIEDPNIRYVFRLIDAQNNPPDWHSIEYSESCTLGGFENSEGARSKASAVQRVQELADQEDLDLTEDAFDDGSIRFYVGDEWVATIAKITFEDADDKLIKKTVSVLKLSTSIHDEACLRRIFSPLLSTETIRPGCVSKHSRNNDYFTYSTLNNLAAAIKKSFARLDSGISLGHAQELLAAFFNYPSWNHLRAVENSCEGIAINPAVVLVHQLPVYLASEFGWDHWTVGGFLAIWIIGYGLVQGFAPKLTGKRSGKVPDGRHALGWAITLGVIPVLIACAFTFQWHVQEALLGGLLVFGALFAINSSLHSYLIVSYAGEDGVSLDVGFYYMANAMGRLIGTVLSGWLFQEYGLEVCLWVSAGFIFLTALISIGLPKHPIPTAGSTI